MPTLGCLPYVSAFDIGNHKIHLTNQYNHYKPLRLRDSAMRAFFSYDMRLLVVS